MRSASRRSFEDCTVSAAYNVAMSVRALKSKHDPNQRNGGLINCQAAIFTYTQIYGQFSNSTILWIFSASPYGFCLISAHPALAHGCARHHQLHGRPSMHRLAK